MKLQYVASSKDGKAKGTVTGDYVADVRGREALAKAASLKSAAR